MGIKALMRESRALYVNTLQSVNEHPLDTTRVSQWTFHKLVLVSLVREILLQNETIYRRIC